MTWRAPALVLALIVLAPGAIRADDTDFSAAAKKIRIQNDPSVESRYGKQEWFQAVKTWVADSKNWEEAMKTIESRIGLNNKNGVDTVITWDDGLGDSPSAMGGIKGGHGSIQLTPRFLSRPPKDQWDTILQGVLTHEFTHVLQRTLTPGGVDKWPEWLREGHAIYAGGQAIIRNSITGFKSGELTSLDISKPKRFHARGCMVFLYMHDKHGEEKIKKLTELLIKEGKPVEEAFSKATGISWAQFKQDEQKWSQEYLQKREKK